MSATRFCLIRHGETAWNAEKRIQGQIDVGLNATGEAQARAVPAGLAGQRFSVAYSSDLERAWTTATLAVASLGVPLLPESALRERHYGAYQGLTPDEAARQHPELHRRHLARDLDYDYDGGESLNAFAVRVRAGMDELVARHAGGTVLIFTHGGVLDVVYRTATGRPLDAPRDYTLPNAGINWVECQAGQWRVLSWADRRHLEATLDEVMR